MCLIGIPGWSDAEPVFHVKCGRKDPGSIQHQRKTNRCVVM